MTWPKRNSSRNRSETVEIPFCTNQSTNEGHFCQVRASPSGGKRSTILIHRSSFRSMPVHPNADCIRLLLPSHALWQAGGRLSTGQHSIVLFGESGMRDRHVESSECLPSSLAVLSTSASTSTRAIPLSGEKHGYRKQRIIYITGTTWSSSSTSSFTERFNYPPPNTGRIQTHPNNA